MLKKAFEEFKNIPFPPSSAKSDELSEIFIELISYDSFVAGNIDSFIGGKKKVDLSFDTGLEYRISSFVNNLAKDDIDYELAIEIQNYLMKIKKLLLLESID